MLYTLFFMPDSDSLYEKRCVFIVSRVFKSSTTYNKLLAILVVGIDELTFYFLK